MAEHPDYRDGKDLYHPMPELYTTFLDAFEVTAEVLLSPIDVRTRCSCLLCPSCLSLLHAHTHSLFRSVSLSHAHTQTHSLSLTHTHTYMRSQMTSFIAAYAGSCRLRKSRICTTQISCVWTRSLMSFLLTLSICLLTFFCHDRYLQTIPCILTTSDYCCAGAWISEKDRIGQLRTRTPMVEEMFPGKKRISSIVIMLKSFAMEENS